MRLWQVGNYPEKIELAVKMLWHNGEELLQRKELSKK